MNANQLINMVFRLFVRKAVSKGIDAGFNKAASMRGGSQQQGQGGESQMSKAEVRQARQAKKQARQARQAAKVARRVGRM